MHRLILIVGAAFLTACNQSETPVAHAQQQAPAQFHPAGNAINPDEAYWNDLIARYGQHYEQCVLEGSFVRPAAPASRSQSTAARNILVALDSSGSMAGRLGGERKIDAAKRAAIDFLNALPVEINSGLIVYGHRGNNHADGRAVSCAGVEELYPLGPHRPGDLVQAIASFEPRGWTPLASAIRLGGDSLSRQDEPGKANVMYVVSDGLETCGGDPVSAARSLRQLNIRTVVNIIGFQVGNREQAALRAIAQAGGGEFFHAETGEQLRRIFTSSEQSLRVSAYGAANTAADTFNKTGAIARSLFAGGCFQNRMTFERNAIENKIRMDSGGPRPRIGARTVSYVHSRLEKRLSALGAWQAAQIRKHEEGYNASAEDLRRDLDQVLKDLSPDR